MFWVKNTTNYLSLYINISNIYLKHVDTERSVYAFSLTTIYILHTSLLNIQPIVYLIYSCIIDCLYLRNNSNRCTFYCDESNIPVRNTNTRDNNSWSTCGDGENGGRIYERIKYEFQMKFREKINQSTGRF